MQDGIDRCLHTACLLSGGDGQALRTGGGQALLEMIGVDSSVHAAQLSQGLPLKDVSSRW